MIAPQLSADGRSVRLPLLDAFAAPLLDELAVAYADDPDILGQLLAAHAGRVLARDYAECSTTSTDYGRAMCAAEADGTRAALLEELSAEVQLDPHLTHHDAVTLAARLTRLAGTIRHTTTTRSARP